MDSQDDTSENRRIFPRVEHIVHGWYRIGDEKFKRCKTLDVSLLGALLVLDRQLEDLSQEFELHLDLEPNWQVPFLAKPLWQRPIFFGKQFLTAVTYRTEKAEDKSMLGLFIQREKRHDVSDPEYLKPLPALTSEEPQSSLDEQLRQPREVVLVLKKWRQLLKEVKIRVPWVTEDAPLKCRRAEPRAPVGMDLTWQGESKLAAELLNVSRSGASFYLAPSAKGKKSSTRGELVVPDSNLLVGRRRVTFEEIWSSSTEDGGSVVGGRFVSEYERVMESWVGDLLKRLDYQPRQLRSVLRLPYKVRVRVESSGTKKTVLAEGETIDVGLGGCYLQLDRMLPEKESVDVILQPDDVSELRLPSRVVHREFGKRYGISFYRGKTESHHQLSRWLSGRSKGWDLSKLVSERLRGAQEEEEEAS